MNHDHLQELTLALSDYLRLFRDGDGNFIDAARGALRNVLAFSRELDVQSFPGNERDMIYRLQSHCNQVNTLLARPKTNTVVIEAACIEAVEQLCYLLELVSIPWATAVETLCL